MVFTLQALLSSCLALDASSSLALVSTAALLVLAFAWAALSPQSPELSLEHEAVREPLRLPTAKPIVADTFDLVSHMDDLHDWMAKWALHFQGAPFQLRMVGVPDINVLYTPQHVEDVFKTQFENFPKGPVLVDNMRDVLGVGIFAVDGKPWVHQRKIASRMFTMRAMRESMAGAVAKHLAPLSRVFATAAHTGAPIDLFRILNRFTMEAFTQFALGIEMNSLEQDAEHPLQKAQDRVQEVVVLRFMRPVWFWKLQRWLNLGAEADMKREIATLDTCVYEMVTKALERRAWGELDRTKETDHEEPGEFHGLVSLFMDHEGTISAEDRGGVEFDAKFFRDIIMNFLFAGRDTTAQALSWLFVELDGRSEVEMKIRDEIARIFPGLTSNSTTASAKTPAIDELHHLVYMEAVIRETLRLHPPIPIKAKYVACDTVLSDGTLLRKGSSVSVASWVMARMAFVWGKDAAEFKPARWIDPTTGKIITESQFKFISFNAGPRVCLGIHLAMMEMKMALVELFGKFQVTLVPNQNTTYVNSVTLPIKGQLLATIHSLP